MTSTKLNKLLKVWQKRLRIQDWDIRLQVLDVKGVAGEVGRDVLGACRPELFKRKADIVLLDEKFIEPGNSNQETILVHELMHIVLNPDDLKIPIEDETSAANIAYERAVDQLAHILVEAYNG